MRELDVQVTRDGKWWMVAVPEIDGLTQARRLADTEQMAREYISLSLDLPLAEIAVRVSVDVEGIDVAADIAHIRHEHDQAVALESAARAHTEQLARRLAAAKVPLRDIGTVMGVSYQRAHQLVSSRRD